MGPSDLLYRLYERRLAADLRRRGGLPRHVGVILDGNRRWARELGMGAREGYRRGADQIDHLLDWSAELGIPVVTLWLLSTENLLQRHPAELAGPAAVAVDDDADVLRQPATAAEVGSEPAFVQPIEQVLFHG